MSLYSEPKDYHRLEESLDSEHDGFLSEEQGAVDRSRSRFCSSWLFLAVVSWLLTGLLGIAYVHDRTSRLADSYEHGWATDFVTARQVVSIEKKTFTGAPAFHDDGEEYIPHADPVRYAGPPSPEIDLNWERLIGGRYFLVTEDEAKATWGRDYQDYWEDHRGGYVAGLDIFHTLHCLNLIRRRLHPEYYISTHGSPESHASHDGTSHHCLEQIRQYLMCAGDLTVLGTRFYPGLGEHGRNYVLSDVPHTCRNFDRIREWTWERYNGSTAVQPDLSRSRSP